MSGAAPFFWANGQANDETFNTATGSPVQVQKVPLSAIASSSITSVANIAALEALPTVSLPAGQLAYVRTVGAYWTLQPTSALTPDGITIVPALGGGQWIRTLSGVQEAAQQQATWFISAAGSDENTGLAGHPLVTVAEIARRMGTWSPRNDVQVTITLLDTVGPDDVIQFTPVGTENIVFLGAATVAATGVLAGVTAKNTATGHPLTATDFGAVQGQLVINHTRGESTAFVVGAAGGVVTFGQPLGALAVPPALTFVPVEDDTWANGDSFSAVTFTAIRVLRARYDLDTFGAGNAGVFFYQCHFLAPSDIEGTELGNIAILVQCSYDGSLVCDDNTFNITLQQVGCTNNFASLAGGVPSFGQIVIQGGVHANLAVRGANLTVGVVITAASTIEGSLLDDVDVLLDVVLTATGAPTFVRTFVWGQGTLNVQSSTVRTGNTAANSLKVSSLLLDGLSVGWATASAAGTVTWSGPRNLTAALLDTAVGGGGFTDATAYGTGGFTAQNGRSTLTNISL